MCGCNQTDKKHPQYGKGPKVSKSSLDYLRTEALLSLSKGEGPGHPFRGNQYTEGKSGGSSKKVKPDDRLRSDGTSKVTAKKAQKMKYFGSEHDVTGSVMLSKERPRKGSKVVAFAPGTTKLFGGTILHVDEVMGTVEFETEATGGRGWYADNLSIDNIVGTIGSVDRIHNDVEDMDPISRAEHERDNR